MPATNRARVGSRTRRMARSRALGLLAAGATLALLVGPVGSASAHDALVGTTPAADTRVDTAPTSVTLEFSNNPQALGTEVVVTAPDGTPAADGAPELSRTTVSQPLADGLPAGTYTVDWRATSADGHPLSGTFAFDVAAGSPAGQAVAADGGTLASASSDSSSFPVVWVAIALIAAVAVVVAVRQLRRPA